MAKMLRSIKEYMSRDDGAMTVDFVVLTAAIVGLGLSVVMIVTDGAINQSGSVGNWLAALSVGSGTGN